MQRANYKNNTKTKKKEHPDLSPEEIKHVTGIFSDKGWSLENDDDNAFNNFCETLKFLEPEERKLILELTEKFIRIEVSEYYHYFIKALDEYINDIKKEIQEKVVVYIIPMISVDDFGKNKSSTMLYYLINAKSGVLNAKYKGKASICFIDTNSYNSFIIEPDDKTKATVENFHLGNVRICLIDDFMGSGKTAKSAIEYLTEKEIVPIEKISVVLIAAMKQGIDLLDKINVNTYSSIVCNKGITGTGNDEQKKIEIMNGISEKVGADGDKYLGYEQSEALIKMIRTPNNTFPVYWLKKKNKCPPFLR